MTKTNYFEEDELSLAAIYDNGCREQTISKIKEILPYVREDPEMTALAQGTIRKLEQISDADYTLIMTSRFDADL